MQMEVTQQVSLGAGAQGPVHCSLTASAPQITSSSQTPHLAPWHPVMGSGMAPSSMRARTLPSLRRDTSSTSHSWAR